MRYCVTIELDLAVPPEMPDTLLGDAIRVALDQRLTAQVALEWAGSDGSEPPSEDITVPATTMPRMTSVADIPVSPTEG